MTGPRRKTLGIVTLLSLICVFGAFYYLFGDRSLPNTQTGEASHGRGADEEIRKKTEPPDLRRMIEGWTRDAQHEVGVISKETFAETLDETANFEQNYYRQIFSVCYFHPAQSGSLRDIAMSRRFAKLVEEMREGGPSQQQLETLLTRYRKDLEKLRRQRAEIEARGDIYGCSADDGFDDSLEDPTDLPFHLGFRINAAELLIGQFSVQQALPLILESVRAREGSMMVNWTGAAYACDKILLAEPADSCTDAQLAVRAEYLEWRAGASDSPVFKYRQVELPRYLSPRRPHERATAMGASVTADEGTVRIEIPPVYFSEFGLRPPSKPPADPLQEDIIAFARRSIAAGS